jgi:hypothetical protein
LAARDRRLSSLMAIIETAIAEYKETMRAAQSAFAEAVSADYREATREPWQRAERAAIDETVHAARAALESEAGASYKKSVDAARVAYEEVMEHYQKVAMMMFDNAVYDAHEKYIRAVVAAGEDITHKALITAELAIEGGR